MKKYLIALLFLGSVSLPIVAYGVDFDSFSNAGAFGSSPQTWSHTVSATTTNNILVVTINTTAFTTTTADGISYGGQFLTFGRRGGASAGKDTEIWYLVNPPTGTNTVSSTHPSSNLMSGSYSFFNVNQTNPILSSSTAAGTGSNVSNTITNDTSGGCAVDTLTLTSAIDPSVGAGQTENYSLTGSGKSGASSYECGTGSPITMSWTHANAGYEQVIVSLASSTITQVATVATTTPHVAITGGKTIIQGNGKVVIK